MIRWIDGLFRRAPTLPPARTPEQLADALEALAPGMAIGVRLDEDLWTAQWILKVRRQRAEIEHRRRMRGGIDWPGAE